MSQLFGVVSDRRHGHVVVGLFRLVGRSRPGQEFARVLVVVGSQPAFAATKSTAMNRIREIKSALIEILYWAIRVAAAPLLVFYFVYRSARDPRYSRRFSERLGGEPASFHPTPPGAIWLHAVSVGEVVSAAGLLREIREHSPSIPLYVSVATVAGRAIAEERLGALADGSFMPPSITLLPSGGCWRGFVRPWW